MYETPTFVRGGVIAFPATFTDASGNPFTPTGANITLTYYVNGTPTQATYAMIMSGATANYSWDSTPADAKTVTWFIKTSDGSGAVAEGSFLLLKNTSNPGP